MLYLLFQLFQKFLCCSTIPSHTQDTMYNQLPGLWHLREEQELFSQSCVASMMIAQLLLWHYHIIFNAWNSESKMNHWTWQAVILAARFYRSFWTYTLPLFLSWLYNTSCQVPLVMHSPLERDVILVHHNQPETRYLIHRWYDSTVSWSPLFQYSFSPSIHLLSLLPAPGYACPHFCMHVTKWHWSTQTSVQKRINTAHAIWYYT